MKKYLLCTSKGYGDIFNCIPGKLYIGEEDEKTKEDTVLSMYKIFYNNNEYCIFYKHRFIELPNSKLIKLLYE